MSQSYLGVYRSGRNWIFCSNHRIHWNVATSWHRLSTDILTTDFHNSDIQICCTYVWMSLWYCLDLLFLSKISTTYNIHQRNMCLSICILFFLCQFVVYKCIRPHILSVPQTAFRNRINESFMKINVQHFFALCVSAGSNRSIHTCTVHTCGTKPLIKCIETLSIPAR